MLASRTPNGCDEARRYVGPPSTPPMSAVGSASRARSSPVRSASATWTSSAACARSPIRRRGPRSPPAPGDSTPSPVWLEVIHAPCDGDLSAMMAIRPGRDARPRQAPPATAPSRFSRFPDALLPLPRLVSGSLRAMAAGRPGHAGAPSIWWLVPRSGSLGRSPRTFPAAFLPLPPLASGSLRAVAQELPAAREDELHPRVARRRRTPRPDRPPAQLRRAAPRPSARDLLRQRTPLRADVRDGAIANGRSDARPPTHP